MSAPQDLGAALRARSLSSAFGTTVAALVDHFRSPLATPVPLQFSVAEFDPDDFQQQAAQVVTQWQQTKGRLPEMHYLSGHNHLTPALSVGSEHRETERMMAGFVRRVTA